MQGHQRDSQYSGTHGGGHTTGGYPDPSSANTQEQMNSNRLSGVHNPMNRSHQNQYIQNIAASSRPANPREPYPGSSTASAGLASHHPDRTDRSRDARDRAGRGSGQGSSTSNQRRLAYSNTASSGIRDLQAK